MGGGPVGLTARAAPLVMPRYADCISILLSVGRNQCQWDDWPISVATALRDTSGTSGKVMLQKAILCE